MEDRHKVEWAVQWGLVGPSDADTWAREKGEEPFQCQPDPASFDPMSLDEWTFAMATAWIIWRTPADVCRAWEPYATECRTWHSIDYIEARTLAGGELIRRAGFEARPGEAPSPHDVIGGARASIGMTAHMGDRFSRPPPVLHPNEVEGQIIAALRKRDGLVAFHSVMPDEPVDRYEWAHLSPFTVGKGPHDAVFYPSGKMVRFSQVRVKRETVTRLWPVVPDVAPIAVEAAAVELPAAVPPEVGEVPSVEAAASHDVGRSPSVPRVKAKRSMDGAHEANADKSAVQIAQRVEAVARILRERGNAFPIMGYVRLLKLEFGEDFPASKATVQPELKAAKDRLAEKK
jgi:hypothetical protein